MKNIPQVIYEVIGRLIAGFSIRHRRVMKQGNGSKWRTQIVYN